MSWGMLRDGHYLRWRDRLSIAALLLLAVLATGCGSGGNVFGGPPATTSAAPPAAPSAAPPAAPSAAPPAAPSAALPAAPSTSQPPPPPATSQSFSSKITSFFSGASAKSQQPVAGAPQPDFDCPLLDIRSGASTLQIPLPTEGQNSTMSLKYQGTFVRAARDCADVNHQMVLRVGVEGRLIVGPAGGPGEVDVPLRIAVVQERTSGTKPIVTKFIRIPVTVEPGQGSATFAHVEEGLSFPMPPASEIDSYIVYIGFDPLAEQAQDQAKEKAKPKPKLKPKPKPTAPTG